MATNAQIEAAITDAGFFSEWATVCGHGRTTHAKRWYRFDVTLTLFAEGWSIYCPMREEVTEDGPTVVTARAQGWSDAQLAEWLDAFKADADAALEPLT